MIFSPHLIREVMAGRKREHRMPIREPQPPARPRKNGNRNLIQQQLPRRGYVYPLQATAGADPDTHIEVTAVHTGTLATMTDRDRRLEGFATLPAFGDHWMRSYDPDWPPVRPCQPCEGSGTEDCADCYRLDPAAQQIVGQHAPGCTPCRICAGTAVEPEVVTDAMVLARFEEMHVDCRVYVVEFKIGVHGEFLCPAARPAGTELAITSNPQHGMRDEAERMDADLLRLHWQEDARQRHQAARPRAVHPDDKLRARRARNAVMSRDAAALRRLADELDDVA